MSAPFAPHDLFGREVGLVLGTALGFAFGFVLERSGFGRAPLLAAQFYGGDNRVLKVMFSAIVTAALGVALVGGVGLLGTRLLTIPETFVWPQLAGGLLLGAGFIVSGCCPGMSIVAAASGNLDGPVTVLGVMAGSLGFGFLYPLVADFHASGALGVTTLGDLVGWPEAVLAAAVAVVAAVAFLGAERLERWLAAHRGTPLPRGRPATRNRVLAGFAAATIASLAVLAVPRAAPHSAARAARALSPIDLARAVVERPESMYLVDVRPAAACKAARIPGAICLAAEERPDEVLANLPPTRRLVLYGEGDLAELPPGAERFAGPLALLSGGMAAFQAAVLSAPAAPASAEPEAIAVYRLRLALHAHFTGARVREAAALPPRPVQAAPSGKKKGGGC